MNIKAQWLVDNYMPVSLSFYTPEVVLSSFFLSCLVFQLFSANWHFLLLSQISTHFTSLCPFSPHFNLMEIKMPSLSSRSTILSNVNGMLSSQLRWMRPTITKLAQPISTRTILLEIVTSETNSLRPFNPPTRLIQYDRL